MGRLTPQQLFAWLDTHPGQLPQEHQDSRPVKDEREAKLARYFRHLRAKDRAGKLPPDIVIKLDQVCLTPIHNIHSNPSVDKRQTLFSLVFCIDVATMANGR